MENEKIIPPGSLISLVQRGFIYSHLENDWFLGMQKNNKSSIQNLIQRRKKFFNSIKNQASIMDKKSYVSTQIFEKKSILFCTWHPRKTRVYYSTRYSLNYLSEQKGHLHKVDIYDQISIFNKKKKPSISYEITSIDFNLIGTLFSTTLYNGYFVIWTETGIPLSKTYFLNRAMIESKWSENSRNLVLLFLSGEIEIWSSWYSQSLLIFLPHRSLSVSLEWTEIICLAVFSKDKIFSKLNLFKKKLFIIRAHNFQINDLVYSSEKEIIGSCSDDFLVKLWNQKKLELIGSLNGHEKEVCTMSFKPINFQKNFFFHGWFLISASLDFSLRVWNMNSKNCLRFFRLDAPIFSMEWGSSSKKIIIGIYDKVLIIESDSILKEFREINGTHSIFSLTSHPMIDKNLGFSYKSIFVI